MSEDEKARTLTVFYKAAYLALDAGFSVPLLQQIVMEVAHGREDRNAGTPNA